MAHGSDKSEAGKHGQFQRLSAQELQDLRDEMGEAGRWMKAQLKKKRRGLVNPEKTR